MSEIVLRVRLIGGDHVDVTYEEAGAVDPDTVTEHAIATLTQDASVLRTRHGDRLVVGGGERVVALRDHVANVVRGGRQPESVLDVALVLADLLRQLADRVAEVRHLAEHRRLLQRGDVFPLEVLDDRDLERGVVVEEMDTDAVIERGECDFVTDIAAELPLQVIAKLLGFPA